MSEHDRPPIRTVGIVYRERSADAAALARTLVTQLQTEGREAWSVDREHEDELIERFPEADLALVLGGDGTILSVARRCAPLGIPILGINFGRVGFLTELEPDEAREKLSLYLGGDYWMDERAMLQGELHTSSGYDRYIALNDIALVRGAAPHVVHINVGINGHHYNTTVADGIIVSTATGSTAYNLAAGGPILHPQVHNAVLTPIAPHLVADRSLVLEPDAVITLALQPDSGPAVLSADGQINRNIEPGTEVVIRSNAHVTRFLRRRPPTYFYRILSAKLRENL